MPLARAVWMMPTYVMSCDAIASNLSFKCSIEPDWLCFLRTLVGDRPFCVARLVSGIARELLDLRRLAFGDNLFAVNEENALVVELDHHHSFHVALWYMNPRL